MPTKPLAGVALAITAALAAPAAGANTVLDFDRFAPTLLGYNQTLEDQGYRLTSYLTGEDNRPDDLAGAIFAAPIQPLAGGWSAPSTTARPATTPGSTMVSC